MQIELNKFYRYKHNVYQCVHRFLYRKDIYPVLIQVATTPPSVRNTDRPILFVCGPGGFRDRLIEVSEHSWVIKDEAGKSNE